MNTYFDRYAYSSKLFNDRPEVNLKLSIVIPCFNEPNLIKTLDSLNSCFPIKGVEVIVIVNQADECSEQVGIRNLSTLKELQLWQAGNTKSLSLFYYHLIAPNKLAGVGYARKVGMDEAARRFEEINHKSGVICCFDADSTCSTNYLKSVYDSFYKTSPKPSGASIYFEHIFPENADHREGIIQYELHLRYYVNALKYINYPFAHQTVGSSMAVRSDVYQKVGGMNKRKAGEDFYFLQRVMPAGNFIDINSTTIYPSARISDRVPFGTGKAMEKWQSQDSKEYFTYNLASFMELKELFEAIPAYYQAETEKVHVKIRSLPLSVAGFIAEFSVLEEISRLNSQSKTKSDFLKNWFQYFDGFRVLKYLHYSRDKYYKNESVIKAATKLARLRWPVEKSKIKDSIGWLNYFRGKDKDN